MGCRLRGFDYTRPYFYMVTIRRNEGFPEFARVVGDAESHYLETNATTRLFVDIIKTFHETWYCIEPITCFAIMPDHIHLLVKIRDIEKRVSLAVIVRMLTRALEKAYFATAEAAARDRPGEAGQRSTFTGEGGARDRPGEAGQRNTFTGEGARETGPAKRASAALLPARGVREIGPAKRASAALLPARMGVVLLAAPPANISSRSTGMTGSSSAMASSRRSRATFARTPRAAGFGARIASIFSG